MGEPPTHLIALAKVFLLYLVNVFGRQCCCMLSENEHAWLLYDQKPGMYLRGATLFYPLYAFASLIKPLYWAIASAFL